MRIEELFGELRKLARADKLRAMEILVLELAAEEELAPFANRLYEVWSPFDAPLAAERLMRMLEKEGARRGEAHLKANRQSCRFKT